MSYSITLRAATVAAALALAASRFDAEVVASQPPHKADRDAALKNVEAALGTLSRVPGEGEQIVVQMHGSVGGKLDWQGTDQASQEVTSCTIGASAWIETIALAHAHTISSPGGDGAHTHSLS